MPLYTIGNKLVTLNGKYVSDGNMRPVLYKTRFNSITTVINSLLPTESAICIIRHSVRDVDKWGATDPLNAEGIAKAKEIGKLVLKTIPNIDIYYGSTGVTRAAETAYYLSIGYGDTKFNDWRDVPSSFSTVDKTHDIDRALSFINGDTFTSEGDWTKVLASAKANGIQQNAENVISSAINYWNTHGKNKLSFLISHDNYEVPFIAYASGLKDSQNEIYNIELTPERWCNYMSGVVIIVEDNKYKEIYPLRCFSRGTM